MPQPQPKVLVVEDTETHAELILYHLSRVGFTVTLANTAEEALVVLRSGESFQMAMVDIRLPGMSGMDLIPLIKRDWPDIIIGVVTATVPETDYEALRNAGATILFGKPFMDRDAYYLLSLIRETGLAFERGRKHRTKWDYWRYGLLGAFVGGFSSMLESGVAITIIAPEKFRVDSGLGLTLVTIVGLALLNAVKFAAAHLKQSPLPGFAYPARPNGNGGGNGHKGALPTPAPRV